MRITIQYALRNQNKKNPPGDCYHNWDYCWAKGVVGSKRCTKCGKIVLFGEGIPYQ